MIFRKFYNARKMIQRMFFEKRSFGQRSRKGQVAIILLLVAAAAIIFYAVSLNIGRVSQIKGMVTVASNMGASQLASQMASYGEYLYYDQLGGNSEKCGLSGVVGSIIKFALVIIAVIAAPFTAGATLVVLAIVGTLSAAAVVIQIAVIEPGVTSMYNKTVSQGLTLSAQYMEQGVRLALNNAVTDNVKVPDMYDVNSNLKFGYDASGKLLDSTNRFGLYYGDYLKRTSNLNVPAIPNFLDALNHLVYRYDPTNTGQDVFFLHDPLSSTDNPSCVYDVSGKQILSSCNICCVPQYLGYTTDLGGGIIGTPNPDFPECCNTGKAACSGQNPPADCECGQSSQCAANSPFGADYPYVYDPYYQNANNVYFSFMEKIGRDDENRLYLRDRNQVGFTDQSSTFEHQLEIDPPPSSYDLNQFVLQDTTGFYTPPNYSFILPAKPDPRVGIYPFFYKASDAALWGWGLGLDQIKTFHATASSSDPKCQWCSKNFDATCAPCAATAPQEALNNELELAVDPADPINQIQINASTEIDGMASLNNNRGANPLAPDKVVLPSNIISSDASCTESAFDRDTSAPYALKDPTLGFWKRGGDKYCADPEAGDPFSTTWPYDANCAKDQTSADQTCLQSTDKTLWPDDPIDALTYGIPAFIAEANDLLTSDPITLTETFDQWYPAIADWIEKKVNSGGQPGIDCFPATCSSSTNGYLYQWLDWIRQMKSRMDAFVNTSYADLNVWCVPPGTKADLPKVSQKEYDTFDSNVDDNGDPAPNGIQGDLEDVISCLNWNTTDPASGGGAGNYDKLKKCRDNCTDDTCLDSKAHLPRSLLPDSAADTDPDTKAYTGGTFDPHGYRRAKDIDPNANVANNEADAPIFIKCLDNCSNFWCRQLPATFKDHLNHDLPYYYGDNDGNGSNDVPATDFDETSACKVPNSTGGTWNKTTSTWWANINQMLKGYINPYCNLDIGQANDPLDYTNHGWLANIGLSANEARNQVPKFKKRADYLNARLSEAKDIIKVLSDAETAISTFLECKYITDSHGVVVGVDEATSGPACQLVIARIRYNPQIPKQVIYGWKSPERTRGDDDGLWHIVQVEGRIPGYCDNACNVDQDSAGVDPVWPRVYSETNLTKTQRCFKLDGLTPGGVVKMRVTRVDQNMTSNFLKFPNGQPIWQFRSSPRTPISDDDPFQPVNEECRDLQIADPADQDLHGNQDIYKGAFIMHKRVETLSASEPYEPANGRCWDDAKALLSHGVMSETCAKYYLHGGDHPGVGMRFIKCEEF